MADSWTFEVVGNTGPSTAWPRGIGRMDLEASIVRSKGGVTRTVTNLGPASASWAALAADGSVGGYTALAAGASKAVTTATGDLHFQSAGKSIFNVVDA